MKSTGKRYTEDFKKTIIELYQSGRAKSELAREYGVSRTSIDNWIKLYTEIEIDDDTTINYKELLAIKKENDFNQAKLAIFKFIESWYNKKRIHGSLNYMTPDEYEKQLGLAS